MDRTTSANSNARLFPHQIPEWHTSASANIIIGSRIRVLSHSIAICKFQRTMSNWTIENRRVPGSLLCMAPITIIAAIRGDGKSSSVSTVAWCNTGACGENRSKKRLIKMLTSGKEGSSR